MKMSEVFNLPLTSDYDTVSDRSMRDLATFDTCREDEAAVHAINQHDALTQLNKELVEALERVVKWNELSLKTICDIGSNGARDYYRGIAEEALAKAKELAE
jgi:hypothetical protein